MKRKTIFFMLMLTAPLLAQAQVIELPLTEKEGYGPFEVGFREIYFYDDKAWDWSQAELRVTGIPADWNDVKTGDVETNLYQKTYQSYFSGKITEKTYDESRINWAWMPDTASLSKTPIRCQIAYLQGIDPQGRKMMMVDTDGDLDFGDETPFAIQFTIGAGQDADSAARHARRVVCERLSHGRVVRDTVGMVFAYLPRFDVMMVNFPRYAVATLDGEEIALFTGFSTLSYENKQCELVLVNDSLRAGAKADQGLLIGRDRFFTVNGTTYKNLGVDDNRNVLRLEKMENVAQGQTMEVVEIGLRTSLLDDGNLKLEQLSGKYVLLDFWATWCGPCIGEIPNLKKLYESTPREKFEIVGILGRSTRKNLDILIEGHGITWPQILSDKIVADYGVSLFPTTLLIGPDGTVIARDLRGAELDKKIHELIGE